MPNRDIILNDLSILISNNRIECGLNYIIFHIFQK